jgi:hypothetical protein
LKIPKFSQYHRSIHPTDSFETERVF